MRKLDSHRSKAAGAAPDQDDIALLHSIPLPAEQHTVRGRADQRAGTGRFPGKMLRLRQTLVRLSDSKLAEGAIVRLVSPDFRGWRDHRVFARQHPGIVLVPPPVMD